MTFRVTRRIEFCYGHRLLNYDGKCANLHGHNATAELVFEGKELDSRGMLLDFVEIKARFKTWIDENWDHQMILRVDDPLLPILQKEGSPCFVLDKNPTAEVLAQKIFELGQDWKLPISEVKIWETGKQAATYRRED